MSEPDGARNQEQIAASHEIDGVRKEKERLTAASLNKPPIVGFLIFFHEFIYFLSFSLVSSTARSYQRSLTISSSISCSTAGSGADSEKVLVRR